MNHHHLCLVRHFLEAAVQEQDRKDEEKIEWSESGLLFTLVQAEVVEVEEPDPIAEYGGNAEDKEEDERCSFPRH